MSGILYAVVVSSTLDDTSYTDLVLSNEPLCISNINIKAIVGINNSDCYYVSSVSLANIIINAWDEGEFKALEEIKNTLNS